MLRNGVDFLLPGIPIRVAEECSGFNSSFVLFIVSLVAGHLFFKKTHNKVLLALAVIPLAIIRNGFRITTISLLCVHVGPHMIHSPIHSHGGPLFFALSMIPFTALIWWMRRSENKRDKAPAPRAR
jgi:exosortase/archaeosortase family protein